MILLTLMLVCLLAGLWLKTQPRPAACADAALRRRLDSVKKLSLRARPAKACARIRDAALAPLQTTAPPLLITRARA